MMEVDEEENGGNGIPEMLEVQRTRMIVGPEINYHVNTATSAMTYMSVGFDNSWDHEKWAKDFEIKVVSVKHDTAVFELINLDPSIVNSLRRILIAEVPSVAIENVFVVDYDCVVPEEVISHRLGLVPLAVDAEKLEEKNEEKADNTNTVVFKLHVACRKRQDGTLENDKVYSRHLKWLPNGSEYPAETGTMFGQQQPSTLDAKPIDGDIIIAKLRPGQYIELEAHAVRGIGADHAKFSPVGTAWHRLYPEVVVLQDVPHKIAAQLAEKVPAVFSVKAATKKSQNRLHVNNIRDHEFYEAQVKDTITQDQYKEYVELHKRKEHHIFTVESTNSIPAAVLFTRAIRILREKSQCLRNML